MDTFSTHEHCHSCPERLVCRCLNITEGEIVQAIVSGELRSVRDLRCHTGAGDGCTCCHDELKDMLARFSLTVVCAAS